ncbi:hypothetical protein DXB77_07495 [Clostridium sp. OM05-9]|jgi:hypothetical protein|uniref:hypothetical protein n=1 Tax=Clostridium sp. OM05-9 TaxID=2293045 RepID=UPI000E49C841|nr:hypothetical protein [Clostridium sp. OM05-9]RHV11024.1 hypothetical protein DXB77_07495 [Clostridium sp. OM05-9]
MNGSIKKNISVIIVILLVICIFMNHRIKISAIENSVDEELVKNLIIGEYSQISDDTSEYLICTKDNIKNVTITNKYVTWDWFSRAALIDFSVILESEGKKFETTGYLGINFDKKKPSKWRVEQGYIRGGEAVIYE